MQKEGARILRYFSTNQPLEWPGTQAVDDTWICCKASCWQHHLSCCESAGICGSRLTVEELSDGAWLARGQEPEVMEARLVAVSSPEPHPSGNQRELFPKLMPLGLGWNWGQGLWPEKSG